ncbi:murinoglobulin-1-like [Amphibalanus amphitrite]|uniref:murinoglobulin-1-like n=1 Tax=Amphibalanus amphitrite TaxID=1232801 RepID=UPI001C8FEB0C|nr:murinoglobulin-1-like [Amphibalanus amphitrite]
MGTTAEYPALLEEDKSSFLLSLPNVLHAGPDDACNYLLNFRNFDGHINRLVLNFTTDDHHPLFSVEKNFLPTTEGRAPPRIAALCRPPPPGQPFGGCDDTPEPPSGFPRYSRSLRSVDSSDCVSVPVPLNISDHKEAKVSLKLNAHDGLFTAGPEKIKILRGTPPIKLTNHDKPQYRPGDHAHFQLLLLDWRLRPLGGLGRSQTFRDGQEPSTVTKDGYVREDWKMHYKTDDFYHWEEFHVGDVSPLAKFDVDITAPEKITNDEDTISVTVCVTYKSGTPLVEASVDAGLKAAMGIDENSSRMAHALTDSRGCAVLDMIIRLERDIRPMFINILINVTDSTSLIKEERSVSVRTTNMLVDVERIVKFDTIPANLSRTLVYRVTYFGEEGPVTNEVIEICTRTVYYPPTRNGFGVNTSSPLADFTYLLPKHELNKLSPELLAELKSLPLLWRVNHTEAETTEKQCRNITTDGEGIAKLKMTELSHRVHTVEIEGSDWPDLPWSDGLRVMTSPSGSYLAFDVAEMPVKLPCHGDIRLPLLSTVPKESLVVQLQVIARDRVVASQTADLRSEELILHMVPEMSPKARLLVYSQLESGEVMADTVEMDVETCFPNEMTVDWTASNAAPDTAADLIVTAEPHSRCTIAVKDSGVGLRRRGRQPYELTRERTLSVFSRLHGDLEDTFLAAGGWLGNMMVPPPYRDQTAYTGRDEPDVKEYCAALEQKLFESLIRAGVNRTSLDNLVKGFKEQYGYVDKDDVTRVFSLHPNADAADVFRYAGMVPLANRGLRYSPCVKDELESWHLGIPTRHKRESPLIQERPSHFYDARENVIYYETQTLDERGKGHVTLRLPGRATRWVATATCTHPQKGFGISEKVPIRASKLLFAEMSIPHSVKAGELLI